MDIADLLLCGLMLVTFLVLLLCVAVIFIKTRR